MRGMLQAACVLVVIGGAAGAEERKTVYIHSGYMKAEDCHESSDNSMAWYMAGVVNGLLVSPFLGAPEARLKPLNQCLVGVSTTQLAATLKKWLRENPERWHDGCHVAAFVALKNMCKF
ncbi:MAG: hypothetical protein OXI22_13200 [Defluviicoccus sp.]|nr:hypothetical protein [Defluviicoccus sp.]